MRKFLRALRILGIVLAVLCLAFGGFILNKHLNATNRWPYATSTRDKAFLNSTWEMSPNEIERFLLRNGLVSAVTSTIPSS